MRDRQRIVSRRLGAFKTIFGVCCLALVLAASASAKTINGCEIKPFTHCEGADLAGADLYRANLAGAHLYHAKLSGADLTEADLSHADLDGADLYSAHLHSANLRFADLSAADLTSADLTEANLTEANLTYAELYGADLTVASLHHADLSGADLQHADLRYAQLVYADLHYADLHGADLHGADLRGAKFCGTWMPNGSMNDTDCGALGYKPPVSRSKTFVLAANTTRTFDVGYPSALKYKHAKYFCDAQVSGPGKRHVKILSRRSARGGTVCRVRARNTAKLPSLDTTAKIKVTATTIR